VTYRDLPGAIETKNRFPDKLVAGLGQIREGVGPPFYGVRLAVAGTIRD